ncbi:phf1/phf2 family PHD finger domain-containing protein [Aspergillus ruber CBS 135680]|uniref:PHD-type domain-containing protein n=1 Tax=Aspergillus ruber (strain CBS 135680) TaxID=1388766 RepID=A0A017SQY6_ASPRC|nr:uncharacterized protein EURHEDRAFT_407339 [Aspergillus ruber CBS 135680]EYE99382.1 hypothetical protein EURHEDRAFT_407339 [Aspergillus ruber CBS 135680]
MTQENGVSPQASIETTPSSHTQLATSSSMPQGQNITNIDPSVRPSSDSIKKSGTIPGRVEIPKLSPATTELLARVTGSFARKDGFDPVTGWSSPSLDTELNDKWKAQGTGNMKSSSAFLEITPSHLPLSRPDIPSIPAPAQKDYIETGIINIAPKPADPSSTHLQPQLQPQAMMPEVRTAKQQKAAAPRARQSANGTRRAVKKHRRGDYDDGEGIIKAGDSTSDESDIAPTATQTKSGRQVNRPSLYVPPPAPSPSIGNKNTTAVPSPSSNLGTTPGSARKRKRVMRKGKDINTNCIHCQRGHSPFTNAIVFCDSCNRAWHQLCHDPCIDREVVLVKEKEWMCKECKPVSLSSIQPTVVRCDPYVVQTQPAQVKLQIPSLEVGSSGFSGDECRSYLSSLSHATLVELLVTLADRNPELPIFPGNLKSLPSSKFPLQSGMSFLVSAAPVNPPAAGSLTQKPTNGTSINGNDDATADPPTGHNPSTAGKKRRHSEISEDDEAGYEIEDHRLYPRAGNGLRLSLNPDDLDIMQEDPACPTFSYSLHGSAKACAETNDAVPVWGTA